MSNFRNFIVERKTAIKAEIQALRKELAELTIAESAIQTSLPDEAKITRRNGRRTIKDMVLEVLKDGRELEALKIIEELYSQFGEKIERSSLSPQLSRLKEKKQIQLNGSKWSLARASPSEEFEVFDEEDEENIPF